MWSQTELIDYSYTLAMHMARADCVWDVDGKAALELRPLDALSVYVGQEMDELYSIAWSLLSGNLTSHVV